MRFLFKLAIATPLCLLSHACAQHEDSAGDPQFDVGGEAVNPTQPAQPKDLVTAEGIEAFHRALRNGEIPSVDSLNINDFLSQHRFALKAPQCELDLCLHASIGRKNTFIAQKPSTMVTVGLNSTVDPASLASAPRHIAVAIDSSKAMQGATVQDVQRALRALHKELNSKDRVTVVAMGSEARFLAQSATKDNLDLDTPLSAVGELNLYDGLRQAFDELQEKRRPNERRILIAALASDPSEGIVDPQRLGRLVESYSELGHDFHAIAMGQGLDGAQVRRLARVAGGHFHSLASSKDLDKVLGSSQALNKVTLARDIDIRLELPKNYTLRGSYGAKIHSQGDSHVTVRVPAFDLVAKKGTQAEGSIAQKVLVLELEQDPKNPSDRIGELRFSYVKGQGQEEGEGEDEGDERIEGGQRILIGPSSKAGEYFENDAARRAFGLISLYSAFDRTLKLAAKDDHARALQMLDTLQRGVQGWLSSSAPEPATQQELNYVEPLKKLVGAQVDSRLPEGTPPIDPIVDPG